ncbi:riboflavin synthase [Cytophagaceae bacterium YF14B1]|uniref:Riboflavin synthase n=1 Tax=Xanthocytophaga flava TaxID=3048013 RepID=A0AAE3QUN2_9BACT|nr:riboflavin synthase [Xanthocytophaga flavus]MDJ1485805.1 riboflavin synthase [Xanthocytophaga flavus]
MFTGIIEAMAEVTESRQEGSNITFVMHSHLASELKIDQSLSHNGVCLTVTQVWDEHYTVTAIQETLDKTNLGQWKPGTKVNLERCMPMNGRFDGHIVQGHVDQTATCTNVQSMDGSWLFDFQYDAQTGNITVEKGSICVNGVSLTVVNSQDDSFQVAIIPYTYEHTNFHNLKKGDLVNLEFDVIGKYLTKIIQRSYR